MWTLIIFANKLTCKQKNDNSYYANYVQYSSVNAAIYFRELVERNFLLLERQSASNVKKILGRKRTVLQSDQDFPMGRD